MHPPQSRPYRSKRQRPCDVCRRRKHACHFDNQPPCTVCQELGTDCTFNEPPTKRRRQTRLRLSPQATDSEIRNAEARSESWPSPSPARSAAAAVPIAEDGYVAENPLLDADMLQPAGHDLWSSTMVDPELGALSLAFAEGLDDVGFSQGGLFPVFNQFGTLDIPPEVSQAPHATQNIQTGQAVNLPVPVQPTQALDSQDGSWTAQYFGLSGETDPYLLRHMRFSDEGSCNFGQFQYRCVAPGIVDSVSPGSQDLSNVSVPVHFIINAPRRLPDGRNDSEGRDELEEMRMELNQLIDPELGTRLVGLYVQTPDLTLNSADISSCLGSCDTYFQASLSYQEVSLKSAPQT